MMRNHDKIDMTLSPKNNFSKTKLKKSSEIKRKIDTYFREYCEATSIHGFRYFGENRTIFEKVWWFIVFIISLILCFFSIYSVYKKWDLSPVIVTFATKGKSISEIPFPAITICSESKIKHSVFDYKNSVLKIKRGLELSQEEQAYLGYLSYLCDPIQDFNYSSLNYSEEANFFDALEKVTPHFSIINCVFLTIDMSCDFLFSPLITDEGFCYSFNILDRSEMFSEKVVHHSHFHKVYVKSEKWSMENGYEEESGLYVYPWRAMLAGARYGLKFDLKVKKEKIDSLCRGPIEGFRILFHGPIRFPRMNQEYIRIPYNRVASATIRPSQILTSEAVKNYAPTKRQCYFPFEKKLKYFNTYSVTNCDTECITNYTLKHCDCVLFYMPRENHTRICSASDYDCTQNAEFKLQTNRLRNRIVYKNKKNTPVHVKESVCHCMPMCSDIEYRTSSSQSVWNWSEDVDKDLFDLNITENISDYHLSRVKAYFVKSTFIGSERNELYGPLDFLANFGGILGLFTGFSILSLMEIVYFLSIRLICNIRLHRNWTGNTNL